MSLLDVYDQSWFNDINHDSTISHFSMFFQSSAKRWMYTRINFVNCDRFQVSIDMVGRLLNPVKWGWMGSPWLKALGDLRRLATWPILRGSNETGTQYFHSYQKLELPKVKRNRKTNQENASSEYGSHKHLPIVFPRIPMFLCTRSALSRLELKPTHGLPAQHGVQLCIKYIKCRLESWSSGALPDPRWVALNLGSWMRQGMAGGFILPASCGSPLVARHSGAGSSCSRLGPQQAGDEFCHLAT